MEVSGQFHSPATLAQYPPNGRLGALGEKMSLGHTGLRTTTLQSPSPSVITVLTELSRGASSFTIERSSVEADVSSAVKEFPYNFYDSTLHCRGHQSLPVAASPHCRHLMSLTF